jgi:hypothetical protein
MINTIDMQGMRYLNLFFKITGVRTRYFFKYNETIMFCVPRPLLSKSLGKNGSNLKRIGEIIKKRIRIIPMPKGIEDAGIFIKAVINPIEFKELDIKDDEIIINAGSQNKASLIGRNRRRESEMRNIIRNFFKRDFKIV